MAVIVLVSMVVDTYHTLVSGCFGESVNVTIVPGKEITEFYYVSRKYGRIGNTNAY